MLYEKTASFVRQGDFVEQPLSWDSLVGSAASSNYGVVRVRLGLYLTFPGWILGCAQSKHIQVLFRSVTGSENCYVVTGFNINIDGTAVTIGEKFIDPWNVVDVSNPDAELVLITRSEWRHSLNVEEF